MKMPIRSAAALMLLASAAFGAVSPQEAARLDKEREKLEAEAAKLNGQLGNANFVERAPAEKVQELRDRQSDIAQRLTVLATNLEALQ